ncbi:MAG: AbrB/MazE/SpoVT family DNA-binding domain-containing protein [Oscillospiraceae bacterium]|nr:AbrB/MazE/SpoVT family DNA-binding domain-containing protein [Oscillospiraceae bacterium]
MKNNGIVREMDKLGRVVIPVEFRRMLDIAVGDDLEITSKGDQIILTKRQASCIFCGSSKDIVDFEGKSLCRACIEKLGAAK